MPMLSILKSAAFLLGYLPAFVYWPLGRLLGSIADRIGGSRRRIAIENLNTAYKGEPLPADAEEITRKVFMHLGVMLFEFMRMAWLKKEDLNGYVACEGRENLDKALLKGKGVIILTAHLGNWELIAAWCGLSEYPIDIVARDLDNPALDAFVRWVRTRSGNRLLSKKGSMRALIKRLNGNGIAGILADQNVTESEGVFVDFFGRPACTNKGPAILAAATGAAVIPAFMLREGRGHRLVFHDEIRLVNTGKREEDARENTALFTKAIEDMVRERPDEWFWLHRRWKTRPPWEENVPKNNDKKKKKKKKRRDGNVNYFVS
ncbi:MAG: lysophospholipid acyltransferase family protein [Deltaproteobacteria bacterium]|nr:lysophospholipid acyltransferase family protein [Deltaproteobacteria bacterium]